MRRTRFTEEDAREAIAAADSWAEALRLLGMRPAGGNHKTIQKWATRWGISTDHFDPGRGRARASRGRGRTLEQMLVAGSNVKRARLKEALYEAGLKKRECEECGQGELWNGKRISLILDHINGDATDNRLGNLRIACPNCAATFDTHCGRNKERMPDSRECRWCGDEFAPKYGQQRFCSISCAKRKHDYEPKPESRRVERPPYAQLMRELEETNWSVVGRRYGVSDNAVRKWVRWYERERQQAAKRLRVGTLRRLGTGVCGVHSGRHRLPENCETRGEQNDGESRLARG